MWRAVAEALAAGLAVGVLYAINSWSYPVARGHARGVGDHLDPRRRAGRKGYPLVWLGLVLVASFVLILPFMLELRPRGARDRRSCTSRRPFGKWLGDMALIYGILLWPLVAGVRAPAGSSSPHRWRWLGWGLAAGVVRRLAAGRRQPDRRDGRGVVAMAVGDRRRAVADADRRPRASCGS